MTDSITRIGLDPTLLGLINRMVPADDFPSGAQAGVGDFIEQILRLDLASRADDVVAGLAALDTESESRGLGGSFSRLSEEDQDAVLNELARGKAVATWPTPAAAFIDLMARLCAQGFYSDPANGGNRDATSWEMVGYRSLPAGAAWPASEPASSPTISPDQLRARYDAIIVGAGAGGCVAASVLAEAGMNVLLIERGDALSSDQLGLDHLRSERAITGYSRLTGASPHGDPRVVVTANGAEILQASDPRWSANAMDVGGGTRVFGAQAWRFCPEDFRMATIYGVPPGSSLADWPISYDELEPWYDRAEWEWGTSGEAGGDRFAGHRSRGYPMPPLAGNRGGDVLGAAANRLGLLAGPPPMLINSVPFSGRPVCVGCGTCVGFACQAGAKNGGFNTVLPTALATGRCDLLTRAQAERVLYDRDGAVIGITVITGTGDNGDSEGDGDSGAAVRNDVLADSVVLAAGAIETARLMLNSPGQREPRGLGNRHDQVGRNLQAHVYAGAIGLFDSVVQDSLGPGPSIATTDFRHHNPGIIGGAMIANDFVPTPYNVWQTLVQNGVIAPFGASSKRAMRQLWSRLQLVFGPVQEIPNPDSRVEVDQDVRDRFGVPVARLSGDIHPEDRRTARFIADRAEDWLTAAGAHTAIRVTADERPEGPSGGQHQSGTCRMGDDPELSVTDRWGRVWGHKNVLVADGSVHVTNGGVNPVLTIVALAYRNSSRLAEEWKEAGLRATQSAT
jgi:choline dehydrogenase-like flavoprotein